MRYDPLLSRALAREIEARWLGKRVLSATLDSRRLALELQFEAAPPFLALLHPEAGLLLETERPVLGEPQVRFRRLFLHAAGAPVDERAVILALADAGGSERSRVAIELRTNRWNVLILDVEDEDRLRISHVLRPRSGGGRPLRKGTFYASPVSERNGTASWLPLDRWTASLSPFDPGERRGAALREVAWTSTLNIDAILADPEDLPGAWRRYKTIVQADGAWALQHRGGLQTYPSDKFDRDATPTGSLLAGMTAAAEAAGGLAALLELRVGSGRSVVGAGDEPAALGAALKRRRKRLRRRAAALRRQLDADVGADELREIGGLILARLADIPRGSAEIELEDFDGSRRLIELDPAKDPAANADAYFDRAGRRDRALRKLPGEIDGIEVTLAVIDAALERLEADGPSDALWSMAGGRPAPVGGGRGRTVREDERRPYTRLQSSGGLEIRVGRSAKDNDVLTARYSAPEDIWLHARQVKGAHVVLRWGRRDENPPHRDLLEAALVAAVNSAARHSGTVAVDWTRRKYVRKPRKSPVGTVTLERAKTLFVEPDEARVKKMSVDD